jgi:hypothetical protein
MTMVYCSRHYGMYDTLTGCNFCPAPVVQVAPKPKSFEVAYKAVRAVRQSFSGVKLYMNEATWRSMLGIPESDCWIDMLVEIRDGVDFDVLGNPAPGQPVPPIWQPIANALGGTIYIDPSMADDTLFFEGQTLTI